MIIQKLVSGMEVPLDEENITAHLLPGGSCTSAAVGMIAPHSAQRHHQQHRPQQGDELLLIYAGTFRIRTGDADRSEILVATSEEPVFVSVASGEPCSIENVGASIVRFLTVFGPPFEPGEIEWLED